MIAGRYTLFAVLASLRRSDESVGAHCQAQRGQASPCKWDRRRVDTATAAAAETTAAAAATAGTTAAAATAETTAAAATARTTLGKCRQGKHRKDGN
jgi:hypothetical protein